MNVEVTLRYLTRTLVEKTTQEEVPAGCTAGELSSKMVRDEENKEGIRFTGASIVTLVNGRIALADQVLKEGDEVKIMPVAAAG